ncbi:N-acetyl sugar amidotransferase [Desulfocurvus sp. DL9XJH121]
MRYCKYCVQPDTRPGIAFDEEGVCPACRYAEERRRLDWSERRRELEKIADYCRVHNVSGYDCIVGVSGGKDSTRQAVFVRDELGLNPLLLCCSYPPEQLTERGARNLSNLISLGFDLTTVAPAPGVWKRMLREGFIRYGNWCKSTEMALYASAPRVAIAYQIPVVFLGDNPATSMGELSTGSKTGDANKMKYSNTIASGPDELAPEGVGPKDLFWYRYPSDRDMDLAALRVVYLGYFFDFNRKDNAEFSMARGLEVRDDPPEDIGDITGHEALDEDFVIPGQMMKYLKLGFGKATDQVCEEIRLGRMAREEAIRLVQLYDGKCAPRYLEKFRRYMEMDEQEFTDIIESYRNRDLWRRKPDGSWRLKVDFDNNPVE